MYLCLRRSPVVEQRSPYSSVSELVLDEAITTKEGETLYEKVVKQRELERKIRKQKTTRNALKAAGDDEGVKEYDKKIRASTAKLERFCDENGLNVRRDRTEVYGYSDPNRKQKPKEFVKIVDKTVDKSVESGMINTDTMYRRKDGANRYIGSNGQQIIDKATYNN